MSYLGEDTSSFGRCSGMFLVWDFSLSQVKEVWGSAFLRFHSYSLEQLAGLVLTTPCSLGNHSCFCKWLQLCWGAWPEAVLAWLLCTGFSPIGVGVNCVPPKNMPKSYCLVPVGVTVFGKSLGRCHQGEVKSDWRRVSPKPN